MLCIKYNKIYRICLFNNITFFRGFGSHLTVLKVFSCCALRDYSW